MVSVSVVIPVYKSTESLVILENQLSDIFKKLKKSYEIIFINDSPNYLPTSKILSKLSENSGKEIKCISMRKNYGQHFAIIVGLANANGNYVITMDDDLQHPPSEIIKMIKFIDDRNIDAALAVPDDRHNKHHWFRNFGSKIMYLIDYYLLETPDGIIKSSFKIIKHDVAKAMVNNFNSTPAISSLLFQISDNVENIYVEHSKRKYGNSNYGSMALVNLLFNNIMHYSSFPLKFFGLFGIVILILSFIFSTTILIRKLFFSLDYPGYSSTIILISFFGSLNLFGISIIGEYLTRILKEQNKIKLRDIYKNL